MITVPLTCVSPTRGEKAKSIMLIFEIGHSKPVRIVRCDPTVFVPVRFETVGKSNPRPVAILDSHASAARHGTGFAGKQSCLAKADRKGRNQARADHRRSALACFAAARKDVWAGCCQRHGEGDSVPVTTVAIRYVISPPQPPQRRMEHGR